MVLTMKNLKLSATSARNMPTEKSVSLDDTISEKSSNFLENFENDHKHHLKL